MKRSTGVLIAALLVTSTCMAGERNEINMGLNATDRATAADAGLPKYPGAKPFKERAQSSSGANVGLATPLFALKVVALNLQTPDRPERVAAFYRRALAKYGKVLDCSDGRKNERESQSRDEDSDVLACDATDPGTNSILYKVGSDPNQRIVAIKPHGEGTRFSLVHVDTRDRSQR